MARLSGAIAPHCPPPPLEGAGGGAERAGRWGWSMNTVQRLRQETGRGIFHPLPVSPTPWGRFPIDTVPGDLAVSSRSHLTLPEDPVSPRARLSGAIIMHSPAPISQRGWSMNTVQSEMQETGAGNVPSPSPSAPPPGGDSPIDTLLVNSIPSPGFRREPSC